MTPIEFPEVSTRFAENQQEYITLPAFYDKEDSGLVVTCWKPTLRERLKLLFGGKLWLGQLTFNHSLQPVKLAVQKTELVELEEVEL